jgi:hypothetical protein
MACPVCSGAICADAVIAGITSAVSADRPWVRIRLTLLVIGVASTTAAATALAAPEKADIPHRSQT